VETTVLPLPLLHNLDNRFRSKFLDQALWVITMEATIRPLLDNDLDEGLREQAFGIIFVEAAILTLPRLEAGCEGTDAGAAAGIADASVGEGLAEGGEGEEGEEDDSLEGHCGLRMGNFDGEVSEELRYLVFDVLLLIVKYILYTDIYTCSRSQEYSTIRKLQSSWNRNRSRSEPFRSLVQLN
jgi:hypothetical protein